MRWVVFFFLHTVRRRFSFSISFSPSLRPILNFRGPVRGVCCTSPLRFSFFESVEYPSLFVRLGPFDFLFPPFMGNRSPRELILVDLPPPDLLAQFAFPRPLPTVTPGLPGHCEHRLFSPTHQQRYPFFCPIAVNLSALQESCAL